MIRRYFLTGIITILLSVSVFSQYEQTGGYARLVGMGNNTYVVDPYGITVNPAWAGFYHNFLFGDLGSQQGAPFGTGGIGQFVAANFHVGGGLSLGALLARNTFNGFSISRLDPFGVVNGLNGIIPVNIPNLDNNLELFGSFKSGNTAFGFGVAYASTTNESTPAGGSTSTGSASQIGFNAGIVTKLSGNFMLDLGASLMLPGASFEPGTGGTSEVSQTIIIVNGRFFYQYSSKLAFVPVVAFITNSGTIENGNATPSTTTDLVSNTLIVVGIGINYQVGDFLLAGGPGFATASSTTSSTPTSPEVSTSALVFPIWNLGTEWNMNDWFVARLGYVASTQNVTTESVASATTINENIITTFTGLQGATVGVGFRLGNFSLDATVNEDVLRQGFNNIGGGSPTFAYLSASLAIP